MARLSACLIVRDEAELLPGCLASLKGWVDEVVVVDTGSTDETVAIAEAHGAKVLHQPWSDDFSAPRNAAIEAAQGAWVLVVDADERLVVEDPKALEAMLNGPVAAYGFRLHNEGLAGQDPHRVVRLFPRDAALRYRGRIHESIGHDLGLKGWPLRDAEGLHLLHLGYQPERVAAKDKSARNLRLARLEWAEHPHMAYAAFCYARSALASGALSEALLAWGHLESLLARQLDADPYGPQYLEMLRAMGQEAAKRAALLEQEGLGSLVGLGANLLAAAQGEGFPPSLGESLLELAQRLRPADPEPWALQGQWAWQAEDAPGALRAWGEAVARDPKHPLAAPALAKLQGSPLARARLSACMIVKDEAEFLPDALASLRGWVDEIVVVDTGSSDATVAIAEAAGAVVGHFAWCDDFSAARNHAIGLATGDWILSIDADERLQVEDPAAFSAALAQAQAWAYLLGIDNLDEEGRVASRLASAPRLFRRDPQLRYEGRLHEDISPSLAREGRPSKRLPGVVLRHLGYTDAVLEAKDKLARNQRLAALQCQESPQDPNAWMQLAAISSRMGLHEAAAQAVGETKALLAQGAGLALHRRASLAVIEATSLRALGDAPAALAVLEGAWASGLPELELVYELGRARLGAEALQGAKEAFEACLRLGALGAGEGTSRAGLGGFLAHVELMAIAFQLGDVAAGAHHAALVATDPATPPEEAMRLAALASQLQATLAERPAPVTPEAPTPPSGPVAAPSGPLAAQALGPAAKPPAGLAGDPMDSKEAALAQLGANGRDVEAWLALALHEREARALDLALVALDQALRLDSGLVMSWILLGVVLAEMGQARLGEQALAAALRLDPEHPNAQSQRVAMRGLPSEPTPPELAAQMEALLSRLQARLSVCMIVKNEAARLPEALASVRDWADELVVVDTGSTDNTVAIAQAAGAKLLHHPWQDDFAAARNVAIEGATGDWILMLDADERLVVHEPEALRRQLLNRKPAGLALRIVDVNEAGEAQGSAPSLRLFQRLEGLRYAGRLHESLGPSLEALGWPVENCSALSLRHLGHQAAVVAEKDKAERNLALARQEQAEKPEDLRASFKLAVAEWMAGHSQAAWERLKALDLKVEGGLRALPDSLWVQVALAWAQMGRDAGDAAWAECLLDEALERNPGYPAYLLERGMMRLSRMDLASAALDFRACLAEKPEDWAHFVLPEGVCDALPLRLLAQIGLGPAPGTAAPDEPQAAPGAAAAVAPGAEADGLPSRAEALARLAQDERDLEAWMVLAFRCQQGGQLDQALVAVGQALHLDANAAAAWSTLAMVLEDMGLPQWAGRVWQTLSFVQPEHPKAASERRRVHRLADEGEPPPEMVRQLEALLALARPQVSACLIVKDEAEALPACLEALGPWVDEVVVVDTGSTDGTVAIAEAFGAKVLHHPWDDDFAAARNASLAAASHGWLLVVDADELLVVADPDAWFQALRRRSDLAYALTLEDLDEAGAVALRFGTVRLFQAHEALRFRGRLHESISASLEALGGVARSLPSVCLRHDGHHSAAMLRKNKAERNARIALREVDEAPEALESRLKLAASQLGLVSPEASLAQFQVLEAADWAGMGGPTTAHAMTLQVQLLKSLGHEGEAESLLNRALQRFGGFPDFHLDRAASRALRGDYLAAAEDLRACLAADGRDFGAMAVRAGATGLLPRQALVQLGQPEAGPVAVEALAPAQSGAQVGAEAAPKAGGQAKATAAALAQVPLRVAAEAPLDGLPVVSQPKPASNGIPTVAEAKAVLAEDPRDAVAWLSLAWHAMEEGALDKALVALDQHLRLDASLAAGWALLGLTLAGMALPRWAERAWRMALAWDPEHPTAREQMVALRQEAQEEAPADLAARLEGLLALGQPRLSACMIVKNEAKNLPRCLASLGAWVDEIVVVDTGSTDDTVAIAEAAGAVVAHHPWGGHFAEARNVGFNLATGDWILVIDADEELQMVDPEGLRRALAQRVPAAYVTPLTNVNQDGSPAGELYLLRLVQNRPEFRMTGALHENFGAGINASGWPVWQSDVFKLLHHGYNQGVAMSLAKGVRNLEIAEQELAAEGPSPERLLNVARSAMLSGHRARAYEIFRRLWDEGWVEELANVHWVLLVVSHLNLLRGDGDLEGALAVVEKGLARLPELTDFWLERAGLRRDLGDWEGAKADFQQVVGLPKHMLAMRVLPADEAQKALAELTHPTPNPKRVSACLIVKNEAKNLGRCLASLAHWVDEIVVVDTGSTDDTVAIAQAHGAVVGHFPWCDDFSAARNHALGLASGHWLLSVDADESLWVAEPEAWRRALGNPDPTVGAYVFPILNRQADGIAVVSPMLRLFRNDARVRYEGRLHEEVVHSLEAADYQVAPLQGVQLLHDGYLPEAVASRDKHPRNLRLAVAETEDHPDRPLAWYNLARSAIFTQDTATIQEALGQVARLLAQGQRMGEAPYCGYVALQRRLMVAAGQREAAEALLDEGLKRVPGFPEFHYERGLLRRARGAHALAQADFEACLQPSGRYYTAAIRPEVQGPWAQAQLEALQKLQDG